MKILLLGGTGQVGWELRRALAPLGEVIAPGRQSGEGGEFDLAQPAALAAAVRRLAPAIIVNAAAYTAVDQAESEPESARLINAEAPGALAAEAARLDVPLIHYSTDYVFAGTGERPWREDDPVEPLNVYGRSKLAGEEAIGGSGCRHLIFRTSWVYAARGGNFLRTMLRLAARRDSLRVVADQYGAPTGAELIADVTAQAVGAFLREPAIGGIYHVAAAGETSWHGYARFVVEQARALGWPVKTAPENVVAVPGHEFPTAAARPLNSRLDCRRLEKTFALHMPPWQDGVGRVLEEIMAGEQGDVT